MYGTIHDAEHFHSNQVYGGSTKTCLPSTLHRVAFARERSDSYAQPTNRVPTAMSSSSSCSIDDHSPFLTAVSCQVTRTADGFSAFSPGLIYHWLTYPCGGASSIQAESREGPSVPAYSFYARHRRPRYHVPLTKAIKSTRGIFRVDRNPRSLPNEASCIEQIEDLWKPVKTPHTVLQLL